MTQTESRQGQRRGRGRPAQDAGEILNEDYALRAALSAFAEQGYDGASVREMARQMGVSHGLINVRYGSKMDLWKAAVSYGMQYLQDRMSAIDKSPDGALPIADDDLPARLHKSCVDFLIGVADAPDIIRIMNAEGARPGERLNYVVDRFFRDNRWPFARLVHQGQVSGVFRPMHIIVPFTMLAHGAGALFALQPLILAADPKWEEKVGRWSRSAHHAADILVRGLMTDQALAHRLDQTKT